MIEEDLRYDLVKRPLNGLKVVDLFCGGGIGACGTKLAGYEIIQAIDNNLNAVNTYNKNIGNHAVNIDIRKVLNLPYHDVMIASPVCKSFSFAGNCKGVKDLKNGDLSYHFLRLLNISKPKAFIFENVKGMLSKKHKAFFEELLSRATKVGYKIEWKLLNTYNYGVPQLRERLFIVGIRNDIHKKFNFPNIIEENQFKNIRYAIGDLPKPCKNNSQIIYNQDKYFDGNFSTRYLSRNRQKQWNEPSYTIVSQARQLPLYPEPQNYDIRNIDKNEVAPPRRFTVRECLRIQTVPDSYVIDDSISLNKQYEIVGNGIPSLILYKILINLEQCLI